MKFKFGIFGISLFYIFYSCKNTAEVNFKEGQNYNQKYDIAETIKGKRIIGMIDSLNQKNYLIPSEFNNLYIDFDYYDAYITYGAAFSTRNFILKNTTNSEALTAIVNSDNPIFCGMPDEKIIKLRYSNLVYKMPLINKSLKDLAMERLKILNTTP
ncbi:hypothetical protein D3C85_744950 [compost metagenome]